MEPITNLSAFLENIAKTIRKNYGITGNIDPQEFYQYIGTPSSGDTEPELCTVTLHLTQFDGKDIRAIYTTYEDKNPTLKLIDYEQPENEEYQIEVVKNTTITFLYDGYMYGGMNGNNLENDMPVTGNSPYAKCVLITEDTSITLNPDW